MAEEYKPYVDPKTDLKELTLPPLILGSLMAIVLGAANTYLGLKAGMTVAATFPAAVISMAVLRLFKSNILEENIARTTGAVGEALAAGAIFTIPAFVIVGAWENLDLFTGPWFLATALLMVGGILGVLDGEHGGDVSTGIPVSGRCHRELLTDGAALIGQEGARDDGLSQREIDAHTHHDVAEGEGEVDPLLIGGELSAGEGQIEE